MKNIVVLASVLLTSSILFAGNGGGTMNSVSEQRAVLFLSSFDNQIEFEVATKDLEGERVHRVLAPLSELQDSKTLESLEKSFESKSWEVVN